MTDQTAKKKYKRQRANQIIIRLSDEELKELNEGITQSKLSKTDFFIQLIRKGKIIILNDIKEMCMELKKQGVNLNQAIKYLHENHNMEEIKTAIYKCNELYERAEKLVMETESKIQKRDKRKVAGQPKKEKKVIEGKEKEVSGADKIGVSESIAIAKQIEMYQSRKEIKGGE